MIGDFVRYFVGGQHGGQSHITSRQCFTDTHDIRFYSGMFPGKEFAGTSESCCYFVKYQENIIFFAEFFRFTQILRMIKPHTACPLNNRFEDKCRQFFRVFLYGLLQGDDIFRMPFSVKSGRGCRNKITDRKR